MASSMPDDPTKRVCASCGAEIEPEPMTEEGLAGFVDFVRSAEKVAAAMDVKTSRIVEMQFRMVMTMQENERIGDVGSALLRALSGKVN